ncbi:MAG: hypothetical protein NTX51_15055 [Verrucomicrobia bacterium]|nr:hypothetical protein [Verrucomicrobiota bacterium]
MRTIKALACATAVVAGVATSMAQSNVYSLNVVGYYNVPCPADQLVFIANQLNTTNNTIASLIPNPPPGSQLYKFASGNWSAYTFDDLDLAWSPNGNATLNMGEAAIFKAAAATTLTFVGEVMQGALRNPLVMGEQLFARSSMVPQAGLLTTDLKYPAEGGDQAYKYSAGNWSAYTFDDLDLAWSPLEPTLAVGEGAMFKKAASSTITAWSRNFTVQ